jgi:putative peptide zinc metalloprotease protein
MADAIVLTNPDGSGAASPGGSLPALRGDLRISEQEAQDGGSLFVLREPDRGRCFRFREVEHFIASQLDGQRGAAEVTRAIAARFGSAPPVEVIERFVGELGRNGLLEGTRPGPAAATDRIRGDILYLRLKAFDPDRLLDRLLPWVSFCFTPTFLWLSVGAVALALGVAAANWPELQLGMARLLRFDALAFAWLVVLGTAALHEFAHGLTCKRFGGQVREMGFMLIYFQPALYCNVTDAWLFPDKRDRLAVTFAGAWFDILLWALGVLAWRIADPDSWLAFVALVLVATAGFRVLFNLNPLIKLDGYYLLADALEIPNLQQRAFAHLGRRWHELLWGEPAGAPGSVETEPRERRIFLAYGLMSFLYSSGLIAAILWWTGRHLVDRLEGLGALLFALFAGLFFRRPLTRLWQGVPAAVREGPGWFRARSPRFRLACLTAAVLGALAAIPADLTVAGSLAIRPSSNADLRAEVEGVVAELFVREGDRVEAGALVARIASREREQAAALAEERLQTARVRAEEAASAVERRGRDDAAQRAAARATAQRSAAEAALAETELARMHELRGEGYVSQAELAAAEAKAKVARGVANEARARLAAAEIGGRAAAEGELALASAALREAERDAAMIHDELAQAELRAPHAGVITTPDLDAKLGQHVAVGDLVAEVHDLTRIEAEIAVREREIGGVRVGQPVEFKAMAYPSETFRGRVTAIAPATMASELPSGARVVRVTTLIENPELRLKTGMTGYAKIRGERRSLLAVWAHDLLGLLRVELWSWW